MKYILSFGDEGGVIIFHVIQVMRNEIEAFDWSLHVVKFSSVNDFNLID